MDAIFDEAPHHTHFDDSAAVQLAIKLFRVYLLNNLYRRISTDEKHGRDFSHDFYTAFGINESAINPLIKNKSISRRNLLTKIIFEPTVNAIHIAEQLLTAYESQLASKHFGITGKKGSTFFKKVIQFFEKSGIATQLTVQQLARYTICRIKTDLSDKELTQALPTDLLTNKTFITNMSVEEIVSTFFNQTRIRYRQAHNYVEWFLDLVAPLLQGQPPSQTQAFSHQGTRQADNPIVKIIKDIYAGGPDFTYFHQHNTGEIVTYDSFRNVRKTRRLYNQPVIDIRRLEYQDNFIVITYLDGYVAIYEHDSEFKKPVSFFSLFEDNSLTARLPDAIFTEYFNKYIISSDLAYQNIVFICIRSTNPECTTIFAIDPRVKDEVLQLRSQEIYQHRVNDDVQISPHGVIENLFYIHENTLVFIDEYGAPFALQPNQEGNFQVRKLIITDSDNEELLFNPNCCVYYHQRLYLQHRENHTLGSIDVSSLLQVQTDETFVEESFRFIPFPPENLQRIPAIKIVYLSDPAKKNSRLVSETATLYLGFDEMNPIGIRLLEQRQAYSTCNTQSLAPTAIIENPVTLHLRNGGMGSTNHLLIAAQSSLFSADLRQAALNPTGYQNLQFEPIRSTKQPSLSRNTVDGSRKRGLFSWLRTKRAIGEEEAERKPADRSQRQQHGAHTPAQEDNHSLMQEESTSTPTYGDGRTRSF